MKKIYYPALLAFLLSGNLNAQSVLSQQQKIYQSIQDMQWNNGKNPLKMSQQNGDSQKALSDILPWLEKHNTNHRLAAKSRPKSSVYNKVKEFSVLKQMETAADTILCVGHTQYIDGQKMMVEDFEYDQYGLFRMTTKAVTGSNAEKLRYTYQAGTNGYWTVRIIEEQQSDGSWMQVEKVERDINSKAQLIGLRWYVLNKDKTGLILKYETKTDFDHIDKPGITYFGEFEVINRVGTTVLEDIYADNGVLLSHYAAKWFDFLGDFYIEEEITRNEKGEIQKEIYGEFKSDCYLRTSYARTDDNRRYLKSKDCESLNYGTYHLSFDENGNNQYAYGSFNSFEADKTAEGRFIFTVYDMSDELHDLVAVRRYVIDGLNDKGELQQGVPFTVRYENYDNDTKKWSLNHIYKISWLSNQLLSLNEDGEISYHWLNKENNAFNLEIDTQSNTVWDIKSSCSVWPWQKIDSNIFKHYDKEGNLMNTYLSESISYQEFYEALPQFFEQKGNTKQPVEHFVVQHDTQDGGVLTYVFDNDNEGHPLTSSVTETLKNGKKYVKEETSYVYSDTGYKSTVVRYKLDDDQIVKRESCTVNEHKETKTVGIEHEVFVYSGFGEVEEGKRFTISVDNIEKRFDFDKNKGEFVFQKCYPGNLVEIDNDGMVTLTHRTFDKDSTIVNVSKYKSLIQLDFMDFYQEEYNWNKDSKEWEGKIYTYEINKKVSIPCKGIILPNVSYNDTGNGLTILHEITSSDSLDTHYKAFFKWNSKKKKWDVERKDNVELYKIGENKYRYEESRTDEANNYITKSYDFEMNANRQIVKATYRFLQQQLQNDEEKDPVTLSDIQSVITYTYDDKGNLIDRTENRVNPDKSTQVIKDHYEFKGLNSEPSAISQLQTDGELKLDGRHVTAAHGSLITVYDTTGRQLMSAQGEVTLPSAGVYIVKCGKSTQKICCK